MNRQRILISGIVQGIGFRPFLFNFLKPRGFTGVIKNTGNLGVALDIQHPSENFDFQTLVEDLYRHLPPMAMIEEITLHSPVKSEVTDYSQLVIAPSNDSIGKGLTLPPDIATCDTCLAEMRDPNNARFHNFDFIACVQCGPRFTIMRSLPYDRPNSTMDAFPFCEGCNIDYHNSEDRRFHAQTFSCNNCGPRYAITKPHQPLIIPPFREPLDPLVNAIEDGKIVGLKGIGGVNLICRADRGESIDTLRNRKKDRKYKPFAVMMPDIETARKYVSMTADDAIILESFRRPIVLLEKQPGKLPEYIAPGLPNVGILLPYMGIHHRLFDRLGNIPLVFTSGNVSNLPMAIENVDIIEQLSDLADLFYLHDREIYQRCDDSVIRSVLGVPNHIRRSRGYVPEYIRLPFTPRQASIIGVGAELNSTGAISRGDRVFPTQHIGNVRNYENYQFLDRAIKHMQNLLKIEKYEVELITGDLHPLFESSRLAQSYQADYGGTNGDLPLIQVQHHHAHMATLMVDHRLDLDEKTVAITVDGVGYGRDKRAWGGEILYGGYREFSREAHLNPIPMVGGDLCAQQPPRMLLSILLHDSAGASKPSYVEEWLQKYQITRHLPNGQMELKIILNQLNQEKSLLSQKYPLTSSFGRHLDAIASLFNVCQQRTYRGEPAMRLEGFIWNRPHINIVDLDDYIKNEVIFGDRLIRTYCEKAIFSPQYQSLKDQQTLARSMVEDFSELFAMKAVDIAQTRGVKTIGVSGGVAYNEIIMKKIRDYVVKSDLRFLQHSTVPCGDAGISTGQIAVAAAQSQFEKK